MPFPNRRRYISCFLANVPWVLKQKITKKRKNLSSFVSYKGLGIESTSSTLEKALLDDSPFCAIRFGAVEISCLNNGEKIALGFAKKYKDSVCYSMKNNAGYFPCDEKGLSLYRESLLPLLDKVDYLGISGVHMENYFFKTYCKNALPILYEGMEPLRGDWIRALKGKKVLVISPFAADIKEQYPKRDRLFEKGKIPDFELITITSPLTLGEEKPLRDSFFDELRIIEEQMDQVDYDVALIGCGAYGSFLCMHAKEKGKKAIQCGGSIQTMFGILGKRWENREHVKKWVNDEWIRPSSKPKGYEHIEGGTYW